MNNIIKPKATEDQIHKSIVSYLRVKYGEDVIVHHSRNEGNRGGLKGIIDGKRGKEMGVLPGFPDLFVIIPNIPVFFLEVKSEKGVLSKDQKGLFPRLDSKGLKVFVVRSIEQTCEAISIMESSS